MMCPKCGSNLQEGIIFCPNCGNNLSENNQQPINNIPDETIINVEGTNSSTYENIMPQTNLEGVNNYNQQTNEINLSSTKIKKKKNELKLGIITGIVATVLLVIGLVGFFILKKSPKMIFDTAINKIFSLTEQYLQTEKINTISQNYDFKIDLDLDKNLIDPSLYQFVNNITAGGSVAIDYQKKVTNIEMQAKYKNENLANLSLYSQNNTIYAGLGDLFERCIEIPVEKEDYDAFFELLNFSQITDDHFTILNEIKKAMKTSLKNEYFQQEKTSILINNKNLNTTKTSLILTEKVALNIAKDFLTSLNTEKFINSLFTIYSESSLVAVDFSKDSIKTELEAAISELEKELQNNEFDDNNAIEISIYNENGKSEIAKIDVIAKDNSAEVREMVFLDILKIEDKNYSLTMYDEEGQKIISGDMTFEDNKINVKLEINAAGTALSTEITLIENVKNNYTYIVSLSVTNMGTVKITMNESYQYNQPVNIPVINNKVLYTELTDEDGQNILLKLLEKDSVKNLMTDANALLSLFAEM